MDPKIKDTPEKEIGQVESPAASDAKTLSSWDDINKKMDAGTIQRKRPATKSAINLSNNKALEGNVVVNKPDIDSSRLEIIIESSRDSSNSPALDSTSLDSNSAPMELDNSLNKDINDTISHLNAHRKNETTPPEETKEIQQQITDAFKTKASSLPKSSKTQREPHKEPDMEPQELKDKILQVGDRVYAPFPGKDPYNERYYWGKIETKGKKAPIRYGIRFFDGDLTKSIWSKHCYRYHEVIKLMQVGMFDMDPPPKEYQEETVPKTLRKLYEQRCQSCSQCLTRPNCGKCKVCLQNSLSGNRSTTQCCVQKMCSKIHMAEKVQECSFLPQGWMYCFEQEKENPEYGGLVIVNAANLADTSKLTHKFRSFEKASVKSHKLFSTMDANNFYQEIGITPQVVATPTSQFKIQKPSPTKIVSSPSVLEQLPAKADSWTLKELFENRCQTCANCIREKCGECYSCKRAQPGECCVRRMCIKIPADKKAQPAPFFPPDWTIIFDPTKKNRTVNSAFRKLDGLVIISPNGRRFRSIEGVKGSGSCGAFGHIDTFAFYAHVGMHMTIEESNVIDRSRMKRGINRERNLGVASKRQKLGAKFDIPIQIDAIEFPSDGSMSTVFRGIKSLSPTELYRKKCGNCVMCTREECNKCATCLLNASRTRRLKEVCLRKMCLEIPEMDRRQPADGLPRGWSFIFDDGDKDNAEIHPDVRGLKIISSSNMKYSSVEAAINRHTKQLENVMERKQIFYRQIGAHLLEEDKMHPLLRKGYCREWINLDGTKQTIYGRITKVVMDKADDKKKLTVTYVKKNVDLVNSVPNASGCIYAPMSDTVCEKMAWGGCLLYQKKMGGRKVNWLPLDLAPFHTTWIVPEMYRCELVHNRDQNSVVSLPRVTIYHAGFELTFNVRTSTIPNAGYGVFLSCRHIMPDSEEGSTNFELNPGELLDFGVYAPYRLEDKRNDHEFLLKSFIHGFKCESYSFETNDPNHEYVFDITDDITGDPHSMALRHVPPYVNEYSSDVVPVVNARHDVEGALHYLLGHSEERDGSFRFPADGREQEIFVDYGPNYESVRLREGFERIHMEAAEKKKRLKTDELEYLDEIETYTANEVQNTVKLFDKVLASSAEGLNQSVVERMVVVTILLRQRADVIMKELAGLNDDDSFCDNGATDIDQHELKKACGELLFRLCRLWGNDTDMKLRMLGFDIYLKACTDAFKGLQLEDFTPAEFRNLIIDGPPVCGIASG